MYRDPLAGPIVQTGVSTGRKRCTHSAVNVVMRVVQTVLAKLVAHACTHLSSITQVQAEHLKSHHSRIGVDTCVR